MHKDCAKASDRRRKSAVDSHNRRTGVRPVNFGTGDYVLKGIVKGGPKLKLKWTGPYRVVTCMNKYLFEISSIEILDTEEKFVVHRRRLKCFINSDFNIAEEVMHHFAYQQGELLVIESVSYTHLTLPTILLV